MPINSSLQPASDVPAQLQRILQNQEGAWNRSDGEAWAAAFSEDADFINIRGEVFCGREAIAQLHTRIFGGPFKGSRTTITIRQWRQIAPGVVVVDTDYEVVQFQFLPSGIAPTAEGVLKTRMKYIAAQHGEEWHLIGAQNTAILPAAAPRL